MEWNKIDKISPELDELVLLWQENPSAKETDKDKGWVEIGFLNSRRETSQGFTYEFVDCKYEDLFNVTHWQPLPKAP